MKCRKLELWNIVNIMVEYLEDKILWRISHRGYMELLSLLTVLRICRRRVGLWVAMEPSDVEPILYVVTFVVEGFDLSWQYGRGGL